MAYDALTAMQNFYKNDPDNQRAQSLYAMVGKPYTGNHGLNDAFNNFVNTYYGDISAQANQDKISNAQNEYSNTLKTATESYDPKNPKAFASALMDNPYSADDGLELLKSDMKNNMELNRQVSAAAASGRLDTAQMKNYKYLRDTLGVDPQQAFTASFGTQDQKNVTSIPTLGGVDPTTADGGAPMPKKPAAYESGYQSSSGKAAGEKSIAEVDKNQQANDSLALLAQAQDYNKKSFSGPGSSTQASLTNLVDKYSPINVVGDETKGKADATANLENILNRGGFAQLKELVGSTQISDADRQSVLALQGSLSLPAEQRANIIQRSSEAVERALRVREFNQEKINQTGKPATVQEIRDLYQNEFGMPYSSFVPSQKSNGQAPASSVPVGTRINHKGIEIERIE